MIEFAITTLFVFFGFVVVYEIIRFLTRNSHHRPIVRSYVPPDRHNRTCVNTACQNYAYLRWHSAELNTSMLYCSQCGREKVGRVGGFLERAYR